MNTEALALVREGMDYLKQEQHTEAERVFKEATELDPNYIEAWGNLGITYSVSGRPEKAAKCFDRAFEINPEYPWTWGAWGNHLSIHGAEEEAEEALQKCLTLDPNNPKVWASLGMLYMDRETDEAEDAFRKALELDPDNHALRYHFVDMLNDRHKFEDAEENLRIILEAIPDHARAWSLLGIVLYNQGHARKGLELSAKALQLAPDDFRVAWRHARLCFKTGHLEQTRTTMARVLKINPSFVRGWRFLIDVLKRMGQPQEIIGVQYALQELLRANPQCRVNKMGFLVEA